MKFVIRDDDCCAFTTIDDLERCYARILPYAPVNLSVTPFRIPGDDAAAPAQVAGGTQPLPLENNGALVAWLREKTASRKVCLALHGYHHSRPSGLPEYVSGENLAWKTRAGRDYLETLLGASVRTFVPPYNSIARGGVAAVEAAELNLVGMPSFVRPNARRVRLSNLPLYARRKYFQARYGVDYPYVMKVGGHQEIAYVAVTPSQHLGHIHRVFDRIVTLRGVFVFSVHYHAFEKKLASGERIGDVLDRMLEKVAGLPDSAICSYDAIWGQP